MSSGNQRKTLARSSRIKHPSGIMLDTPILVPSFSSKGFAVKRSGESDVATALQLSAEYLTDTMLISAYDIYHQYIPSPGELPSPELTIVDSGGYEASIDHDLSTAVAHPHEPADWSLKQLTDVLDAWPPRFSAIIVSYDHPKRRVSVSQQVEEARELFTRQRKQLSNFLLKPETEDQQYLKASINRVLAEPDMLREFNVVGVTEKELGPSILERMHNIAKLRLGLDDAGISAPIQVFGALDPVSSPMYFLAGAEIFDGLTWLRYAYRDGLCVYQANYGALSPLLGPIHRDTTVRAKTLADNVGYLKNLELSMRNFAVDEEYKHFVYHSDVFERAFSSLRTKSHGRL